MRKERTMMLIGLVIFGIICFTLYHRLLEKSRWQNKIIDICNQQVAKYKELAAEQDRLVATLQDQNRSYRILHAEFGQRLERVTTAVQEPHDLISEVDGAELSAQDSFRFLEAREAQRKEDYLTAFNVNKWPMSDKEHAAIVMFRKLEAARAEVQTRLPEGDPLRDYLENTLR